MAEKTKYFVLKQKAVPEVLLKVVEAKRLSGFRQGSFRTGGSRECRHQPEFFL